MFNKTKLKIISLLIIFILLPVELFGITMTFCQKMDSSPKIMLELQGKCCMEMGFGKSLNNGKKHSQNIKDECCKNFNYNISSVIESSKISRNQFSIIKIDIISNETNTSLSLSEKKLNLVTSYNTSPPFLEENTIIQLI